MKRNRAFRRFAAVFLALFCMAATSTVAFAGGGDGEPYYTEEETTGGSYFLPRRWAAVSVSQKHKSS